MFVGILYCVIAVFSRRSPKIIQNITTKKYLSAMDRDLLLTDDKKSATPFCMKVGDGFNNLLIQICDDEDVVNQPEKIDEKEEDEKLNSKVKLNSQQRPSSKRNRGAEDSLRRSSLIDRSLIADEKEDKKIEEGLSAESALGGIRKNTDFHSGLTLTVQGPLLGSEKLTGAEVILEPESPTLTQVFRILQADEMGTVRIMNENLCLTVKESKGSIGRKGDILIVAACYKEDLKNQFKFIDLSNAGNAESARILDETKLAALKEVARLSPKMREKIGMDYLEMLS